jgi:hypothetical protein
VPSELPITDVSSLAAADIRSAAKILAESEGGPSSRDFLPICRAAAPIRPASAGRALATKLKLNSTLSRRSLSLREVARALPLPGRQTGCRRWQSGTQL